MSLKGRSVGSHENFRITSASGVTGSRISIIWAFSPFFFLALFSTLSCLHSKAWFPLCNGSSIINFPTILSLLWYFKLKIPAKEQGSLSDNIQIVSLRGSDWARALLEPSTLCRGIDNFGSLSNVPVSGVSGSDGGRNGNTMIVLPQ